MYFSRGIMREKNRLILHDLNRILNPAKVKGYHGNHLIFMTYNFSKRAKKDLFSLKYIF